MQRSVQYSRCLDAATPACLLCRLWSAALLALSPAAPSASTADAAAGHAAMSRAANGVAAASLLVDRGHCSRWLGAVFVQSTTAQAFASNPWRDGSLHDLMMNR